MTHARMPSADRTYTTISRTAPPGKSTSRIQSFRYALRGVRQAFRTEINLRVHISVFLLVIALGIGFGISTERWILLIIASGVVVAFELANSAVEALADAVYPRYHPGIAKAKDIAAGAVLLASITALLVGIFIFGESVWRLFGG